MIQLSKPYFDELEKRAVEEVLDSGWLVQGAKVKAFENSLEELTQARHAVVVSSGTAALHIALLTLDLQANDIVYVPSFAWPSAANMAALIGNRVSFVDVSLGTYNIDPHDLEEKIKRDLEFKHGIPKVLVVVHEFGLMAEMDELLEIAKKYHLTVLEDAACALGATYHNQPVGSFSDLTIFSFHPRKSITTGEGGAIITNDPKRMQILQAWRNHGQMEVNGSRQVVLPGLNYRMTEMQAAIGQVQIKKFSEILKTRKVLAKHYHESLKDVKNITLPTWSPEHTWQTYMIVLEDYSRDTVIQKLKAFNIEATAGSVAGHCNDYFMSLDGYSHDDVPNSYKFHVKGLALPLHAGLSIKDVEYVCDTLKGILSQ